MVQPHVGRRDFLKTTAAGLAATSALSSASLVAAETETHSPETLVKVLYDSLSPKQRETICFDWQHEEQGRGLLRTHVRNNWHITKPAINSEFFNDDQRHLIRHIFEGIVDPEWHAKFDKQLQDDAGGFGNDQNIAIFGRPGTNQFEFVMTGRHMTLRCDGDSAENVAFGGPIFYGHAAQGFDEEAHHPGNVFWPQAIAANQVYEMLDGKQRKLAEVAQLPPEAAVGFQGTQGPKPGIPLTELSADQKEQVVKTLNTLLEMYRRSDQDEVQKCLDAQGGLDACHMAFYTDGDIGGDRVWDNWRLEGPSFVWYFRGAPHVHVWVNVASTPEVKTNAVG